MNFFLLYIISPVLPANKTNSYPTASLYAGGIKAVEVFILLTLLTSICMRRIEFSERKILTGKKDSSLTVLLVTERETVL